MQDNVKFLLPPPAEPSTASFGDSCTATNDVHGLAYSITSSARGDGAGHWEDVYRR